MRSPDGVITKTEDVKEYGLWYEKSRPEDPSEWNKGPCRIAKDTVGDAVVSTVFLSHDHNFTGIGPPILWETMIFGGPHDEYQERYHTETTARLRHVDIVKRLKSGFPPEEGP